MQKSFDEGFGESTLRDVACTRLIIPTVNLTKGMPHVFRSRHLPLGVPDQDVKISDVIIAATAAPTYFPHRQIGDNAYVDGGVWAADPSMLAFAESIRVQQFEQGVEGFSHCEVNDIHLLSVGTGRAQYSLSPPGSDAGLLYWASRVADLMGTSQVQGIHLPLKFLLGDRYRHINFPMNEKWPLDGVQYIPELFATGREKAEASFDMINENFFQHTRKKFSPLTSDKERVELDEFGFV